MMFASSQPSQPHAAITAAYFFANNTQVYYFMCPIAMCSMLHVLLLYETYYLYIYIYAVTSNPRWPQIQNYWTHLRRGRLPNHNQTPSNMTKMFGTCAAHVGLVSCIV